MLTHKRFRTNWQTAALDEFLKRHQSDALLNDRAVHLVDAERIAFLDEFIIGELWSAVVRCLAPTPWTTWVGAGGEQPHEAIRTLPGANYMTRELLFLIEDPKRPRPHQPGSPAWLCRGRLEANTEQGFMLSFDFILSVPETFPVAKLLRVLKEPLLCGAPPNLSHNDGFGGFAGTLNLAFSGGKGVSGLAALSSGEPRRIVLDLTSRNVAAINAVHRLERDFGNEVLFEEAATALIAAYEAW